MQGRLCPRGCVDPLPLQTPGPSIHTYSRDRAAAIHRSPLAQLSREPLASSFPSPFPQEVFLRPRWRRLGLLFSWTRGSIRHLTSSIDLLGSGCRPFGFRSRTSQSVEVRVRGSILLRHGPTTIGRNPIDRFSKSAYNTTRGPPVACLRDANLGFWSNTIDSQE